MKNLSRSLAIAGLSALLSACANQAGMVPDHVAQLSLPADARPDVAAPPKCKGQQTTKQYAKSQSQPLAYGGGTVCVPAFQTWGGRMSYPGGASGVSATLISSTTAYAPSFFPPGVTALFWIQFQLSSHLKFNTTLGSGLTLAYPKLKLKKPYTISGADYYGSIFRALPSCYTIAASGKYGPMIGGLGYPLKGGDIHSAFIWVTAGKNATAKC